MQNMYRSDINNQLNSYRPINSDATSFARAFFLCSRNSNNNRNHNKLSFYQLDTDAIPIEHGMLVCHSFHSVIWAENNRNSKIENTMYDIKFTWHFSRIFFLLVCKTFFSRSIFFSAHGCRWRLIQGAMRVPCSNVWCVYANTFLS